VGILGCELGYRPSSLLGEEFLSAPIHSLPPLWSPNRSFNRWYPCLTDEFRELRQGNKSLAEYTYQFIELARYAPEEVDKDSKKQDMFKKGLTPELMTLLTPHIYLDFNTLMNMAILTERARAEEKKENKCMFMENKTQQQERT
jgi:hypothetical protein